MVELEPEHAEKAARSNRTDDLCPSRCWYNSSRNNLLRDVIAEMPERCERMIRDALLRNAARPYDEVARELGLATGSIGFIRGRCLAQLKKATRTEGLLMSIRAVQQTELDAVVEQLLALGDAASRRQLVARHAEIAWDEVVNDAHERVWQEVRVDSHRADRIADASLDIAECIGRPSLAGKKLPGESEFALHARPARSGHRASRKGSSVFRAGWRRSRTGAHAERYRFNLCCCWAATMKRLAPGERAAVIFKKHGNTRRLARLEINIGNIYHRQDRFTEALAIYDRAYQELLKHDDGEALAAVLSNLSLCYISLNDFPKALEFHRIARAAMPAAGHADSGRLCRLQHRLSLLLARRVWARDQDAARCLGQRRQSERRLSTGALQS